MMRLALAALLPVLCAASPGHGGADVEPRISEFQQDPVGADPATQLIEFSGTPNEAFQGFFLIVESDNDTEAGVVEEAEEIDASFDASGLLLLNISDIEDHSHTYLLVSSFTGTAGVTDLDTDNDGVADDLSTIGDVYDAIGVPISDDTLLYAAALNGTDLPYAGAAASVVFRGRGSGAPFQVVGSNVFDAAGQNANAAFGDQTFTDPTLGNLNPVDTPADTSFRIA
eukprot:scaffold196_cov308-Pinguiococcus_pyrenoidosus.AAC.1